MISKHWHTVIYIICKNKYINFIKTGNIMFYLDSILKACWYRGTHFAIVVNNSEILLKCMTIN